MISLEIKRRRSITLNLHLVTVPSLLFYFIPSSILHFLFCYFFLLLSSAVNSQSVNSRTHKVKPIMKLASNFIHLLKLHSNFGFHAFTSSNQSHFSAFDACWRLVFCFTSCHLRRRHQHAGASRSIIIVNDQN